MKRREFVRKGLVTAATIATATTLDTSRNVPDPIEPHLTTDFLSQFPEKLNRNLYGLLVRIEELERRLGSA